MKIGDRVRRDPKIWPASKYAEARNVGTVIGFNTERLPIVVMDADKAGVWNHFTGRIEPAGGMPYMACELLLV